MTAFYHHVGAEGARADFPKTVYQGLPVAGVVDHIQLNSPEAIELIHAIETAFPDGYCNAWGVPEGAIHVIRRLSEGDIVFLIQSLRFTEPGLVCICRVDAYQPIKLPELSEHLWQNQKYPYIFFFKTMKTDISWQDFRELIGYTQNFNPRGQFLSISSERLAALHGVDGLLAQLGAIQRAYPLAGSPEASYPSPVEDPIGPLVSAIEDSSRTTEPKLLDDDARKKSISERPARDPAFARAILRHYGYRCAVCGSGVRASSGTYELEAAHICPVTRGGPDDLRNGLALCRLHHWAFDNGMWFVGQGNIVELLPGLPESPGIEQIRDFAGRHLRQPVADIKPHTLFVNLHRAAYHLPPVEPN
jgi:hypothetical protein